MRRPYAHFKSAGFHRRPAYTQRNYSRVSRSGGAVKMTSDSVKLTRCKTFKAMAQLFDICVENTSNHESEWLFESRYVPHVCIICIKSLWPQTWSMEIKEEMLLKVIQELAGEGKGVVCVCVCVWGDVRVILLLCFINAPPCAPVSESEGPVRRWRLRAKTDFAPLGGGQAGNMWQLICANKHLWRGRRRRKEENACRARLPCHLHRPPLCLRIGEENLTNITSRQTKQPESKMSSAPPGCWWFALYSTSPRLLLIMGGLHRYSTQVKAALLQHVFNHLIAKELIQETT